MSERFTMVVAVHLFLMNEDKVLLARRYNTGYEDRKFSVPAGHVEKGESCLEAMIREAQEEVAIDVLAENLSLAHVMHRSTDRESIDFFFVCTKWSGTPKINEPEKCDELKWCKVDSLPENTIGYIRQALEGSHNQQKYSQLGFPV